MIVRNGAATVERCIDLVRDDVAEVNVYLGGESSDATVPILERLAAQPGAPIRIKQGEWRGDYGWAKTQAFAMASPGIEWLLWLDDDEELYGLGRLRRELTESDAVYLRKYEYGTRDTLLRKWSLRLVRVGAGFEWFGRVHEELHGPDTARYVVAHPLRTHVVERRYEQSEIPGRHRYTEQSRAEYEETGRRDLRMLLACGAIVSGRRDEGEAELRQIIASFTDDADRCDGLYVGCCAQLANSRYQVGDEEEARALMDERRRVVQLWYARAECGDIRGGKALLPQFMAYDTLDGDGWEPRVFMEWEPA